MRGVWSLNKPFFDNYQEFKRTALPGILEEARTRKIGRYGLKVPKGKMSKEDYLKEVFRLNKKKITEAYESFSGTQGDAETVFDRFKQEYNLREQYIYGKTKRRLVNRSEVMNALQRSDFFNDTKQRQQYTLFETMKQIKTGKKRTMLSDFLRDTGYYSMDNLIQGQDIKNYYTKIEEEWEGEAESFKRNGRNVYRYIIRGNDGSIWAVDITNSPVTVSYHKIND